MRMHQRMMQEHFVLEPMERDEMANLSMSEVVEFTEVIRGIIKDAVVVECTNVAEYFNEHYPLISNNVMPDLHAICPPYETVWYEWSKFPKYMGNSIRTMGVLVEGTSPEDALRIIDNDDGPLRSKAKEMIAQYDPKWIMVVHLFVEFKEITHAQGSPMRGPYSTQIYAASADGTLDECFLSSTGALSEADSIAINKAMTVAMLAQSMINCKNIITRTNIPAKKLNKARKKRGKNPLVSFKTIHVDPNQKTVAAKATQSSGAGDSDKKSRGPQRGHIKDYRKGKGLFGRIKGVFYWGPQLRGDASNGICLPDYTIDKKDSS